MKKLSTVSRKIEPSLTRKLFNMAKNYDDVIDFTLGDPDIQPDQHVKDAGCNAILAGKTRYSQNAGLLELRKVIAKKYFKEYNNTYDPNSEIIVTVGAMEGLYLTLLSILNPNDEVIIPAPYWINYLQMVQMCGANPILTNPKSNTDLSISIENVKKAINSKTKAIIINTPSNPSGLIINEEELVQIAHLAIENDIYIIADEVYRKLIYKKKKFHSIATIKGIKDRVILVNSLSKEFCMTGWRLGYVVAPENIISVMTMFQENVAACAPLPSQYAAIEALSHGDEYSRDMVRQYESRKNVLFSEIKKIDKVSIKEPDATFYAMLNISKTKLKSEEFAYQLLEKAHVAVVPGITYGDFCDDYIRIAFTLNEEKIREGAIRIKKFIDSL